MRLRAFVYLQAIILLGFIEEYENASRKTQNRDARRRGDLHFEHKHAFGGVG